MMRITREHDVVQVSFLPRLFPVNVYLVEEEDGFTLIDAGMPFSLKGILATAQSLGKPITRIILTHAHGDHVGALDGLKDALPKAEVCISRRDAPLLAGDASLLPGEPQTPVRGSVPKAIRTRPDRLLDDGDRIGSLVAIATPGHTPGHMAFMDTRSRVIIAGDAYQLHGGLAVSGRLRPLFPFPALATWNRELALASAKRLAELEPSVLALADSDGFHSLTLAALAQRLDVRSPSLYNHINGLPGLRQELALMSAQQLSLTLTEASAGRSGDEAIQEVAAAYIGFVRKHPGLYEAFFHAPDRKEPQLVVASTAALDLLLRLLQPYPLSEAEALHAVRGLRSLCHGFASMGEKGGFGMSFDPDESLQLTLTAFLNGLQHLHTT
ncbi:hypothetical protein G195_001963 [Phytophthora kernoviae 00238/432]|uniref:Metallo-beta-lactamase domain-containing protein n=2 Tax=Phytophthora TaxID=4783 RepID=A0A8J4SBK2_9STRA|nr:hypothetical protein G195_001963 [Phytophthora kernoviae 00238/432]